MSHPYDASTKYLVQTRLADWFPLCGRTTTAPMEVINADLATVTAAADRVLRIHETPAWLLHLELQASRDPDFVPNLPVYNGLLEREHRLLVRTVVVLLRRSADSPEVTGTLSRQFAGEPPYLVFRYQLVRVWQMPLDTFLNGGLGILPLAPLSAVTEPELPEVIGQIDRRLQNEATPEEVGTLWTATDVLMGLRWPRALVAELLKGVHGMKESETYQAIVEEGKREGILEGKREGILEGKREGILEGKREGILEARREDLLRLGSRRFGPADPSAQTALRGLKDLDHLDRMMDRLLEVSGWEELLATP